jgi:hypothetical protein
MRFFFVIISILFFQTISQSQESPNIKFGVLKQEDFDIKLESLDSTAEAVLLYENQKVYFTNILTSEVNVEYFARIKILKISGLDRGNISLGYSKYNGDNEKISEIEGFTYNFENGQVIAIPLESESVFEEKISETRFVKKIILPNVRVGSIIEYKFKKRTPFSINNTPNPWYFQGNIPFKWSEISITIPASLSYRIMFGGYLPLYIKTSEKSTSAYNGLDAQKYRFVVKDAPAFKDESFIASREDYISKVEFEWLSIYSNYTTTSFSNTWGDLAKYLNFHEKFGERIKKGNYLNNVIKPFESIEDSVEKLNAVFNYVANNFSWNNRYSIWAQENLKTVFENKRGSVVEINLLLLVLLKEMGIKVKPVILSSRGNGEIKDEYPMLDKFNYLIVSARIGGKDILMDATDPNSVPGFLPERCLNKKACLLLKDTVRIIPIVALKSTELITINAEMDSLAKEIKGSYSIMAGNYKAHFFRDFCKYNVDGEKGLIKLYKSKNPDWELDAFKTENLKKTYETFKLNFNFSEDLTTASANKIYLHSLFSEGIKENPFKMKDRYYPVDLSYPEESIVLVNFKIPSNYRIEEVPKNIAITLPDKGGKFMFVLEIDGNLIKVRSHLQVSKAYYTQNEYYLLKAFYNTLVQKQAEQIILKKI